MKISEQNINLIKQRYPFEGASKELCELIGVNKNKIYYIVKKYGLFMERQARSSLQKKSSGFGKKHKDFKGYEEISAHYICLVRKDAVKRKIIHPLLDNSYESNKYLWDLYVAQNKKCIYTGDLIYFRSIDKAATASLDRIDSKNGYIKGNVQWVNKDINRMKWMLSQEEFILNCNKIAKLYPRNIL